MMNIKNTFCVKKNVLLFLFLLIIGALAIIFIWKYLNSNNVKTEAVESLSQYKYLSLATIKTNRSYYLIDKKYYREAIKYYSDVISRIGKEGAQLIVMPEYTFYFKDVYINAIQKDLISNEYNIITDKNTDFYNEIINKFKELASKNKTNIFLTSFPIISGKYDGVGFFINDQGKIVGYKIKSQAPVGVFDIYYEGKKYKVLPLICQDAYHFDDPEFPITKPWVLKNQPYDIVVHAINQTDVNFSKLISSIQTIGYVHPKDDLPLSWYRDAYFDYYQPYFNYLSNNPGVIIASDIGNIGGVFNKDLSKINNYIIRKDYDIAKVIIKGPSNKAPME